MPWQRLVADVGGELDPATGIPAFREVIVTVPRQSGKTTLILGWEIQRAIGWDPPQRIAYSAQSGTDARKKLMDDQAPLLRPRAKALGIHRILRGTGNEAIEFTNGSRIGLLASTPDAGHGKTLDLCIKDELFADYDDRRDQAMIPAMATRATAQMLTASTMGTDDSLPLNRAVERGRLAVDLDQRSGIAYFEWSAGEDDDPDDPATWWACMPALGYTQTVGVIAHARSTFTDGEFRRAFQNLHTRADERLIPAKAWDAVCGTDVAPSAPLTFALDVNPERSAGSIVAASGGTTPTAELVAYEHGTDWLVPWAVSRKDTHGTNAAWVVDSTGPAGSLIPEMEREGLNVVAASARDLINACGQFYDGVIEASLRIRRHSRLDEAAAGAARRQVGDSWAWTRRNAATDISPIVAATLALWGARAKKKTPHRVISY